MDEEMLNHCRSVCIGAAHRAFGELPTSVDHSVDKNYLKQIFNSRHFNDGNEMGLDWSAMESQMDEIRADADGRVSEEDWIDFFTA